MRRLQILNVSLGNSIYHTSYIYQFSNASSCSCERQMTTVYLPQILFLQMWSAPLPVSVTILPSSRRYTHKIVCKLQKAEFR
jgi:hypothetical protein